MNIEPINDLAPATIPTPVRPAQPGYWVSREEYERLRSQAGNDTAPNNFGSRDTTAGQTYVNQDSRNKDKKDVWTYLLAALACVVFFGLTFSFGPFFSQILSFGVLSFMIMAVRSAILARRARVVPMKELGHNSALKKVLTVITIMLLLPILIPVGFFALMIILVMIPGSPLQGS
ncbi:MAG: hypothetical protein ABI397_01180 [Candidatus Saccharimonas sp.]